MGKVKKDDRSPLSARSKGVLQKPNTSAAPTLINKHKLQKSKKEKLKEKHETFIQSPSSSSPWPSFSLLPFPPFHLPN